MAKLQVLKYNRVLMTSMGIYPHSPAGWLQSMSPYFMIIDLTVCNILSTTYVYQGSARLSQVFEAFSLVIGGHESVCAYINMRWKMNKAGDVQLKLQEIVDQAVDQTDLSFIYRSVEEKCRQFTKKMLVFVAFQQTSFIIALITSIYSIHIGNYDTSTYFLPLRVAHPFNIDTVFRWYLFCLLQLSFGITYILSVVAATSYFVCCCFYLEALCDHLDYLIGLVDADVERNQRESNDPGRANANRNSLNARKLLSNTIDHHNNIYDIFDMLADLNSGAVFAFLALSAPFLGVSLYNLEHSDSEMSLEGAATIIFAVVVLSCGLIWPFLFCHYGTFATERIRAIDLIVYNANWLYYPPKLQKYIILIISQSHSKINFNGFNLLSCSLEAFAKICRSSGSYYVIFRRF